MLDPATSEGDPQTHFSSMASEGSPQMSSGTSLKWSIFSWQKVVAGGTFVGRMGWRAPALMLCVRGALESAGLLGGSAERGTVWPLAPRGGGSRAPLGAALPAAVTPFCAGGAAACAVAAAEPRVARQVLD